MKRTDRELITDTLLCDEPCEEPAQVMSEGSFELGPEDGVWNGDKPHSMMCDEEPDSDDYEVEELDLAAYFDGFSVKPEDRVKLCTGYAGYVRSTLKCMEKNE